uniref:Uncharacterized protein n=1 Tax=Arsenophonus nasoniae TaxID=638 RepID=D2TY62_9GAMM|nr:hypothetical protein ARN_10680 [Arsenophonus nasoniae]
MILSKSPSSAIRCNNTEPTIPRQPINPTFFILFISNLNVEAQVKLSSFINNNRKLKSFSPFINTNYLINKNLFITDKKTPRIKGVLLKITVNNFTTLMDANQI